MAIGNGGSLENLNDFVLKNEGLSNEGKRIFAATGKLKRGNATTEQVLGGFKNGVFKPSEKNQVLTLYDFLYSQSNSNFPFDVDMDDYAAQLSKLTGDEDLKFS